MATIKKAKAKVKKTWLEALAGDVKAQFIVGVVLLIAAGTLLNWLF